MTIPGISAPGIHHAAEVIGLWSPEVIIPTDTFKSRPLRDDGNGIEIFEQFSYK